MLPPRFQLFAGVDHCYGGRAKGIPRDTLTDRPKVLLKIFRLAIINKAGTLMKINTGFVKSTLGDCSQVLSSVPVN